MMTDVVAKSTEVEWEIVGRYRLIKDVASEARLFDLAKLAADLQCAVDSRDKCTKDKYLSVIESFSKKAPKGNIGFEKMPDTFYNSLSGKYAEEYVKAPNHWKINFGIKIDKPNTKKCNWYLDGIAVLGSGDCNKFQFNIPINAGQTVRVETNDGLFGTVTVNPKDILVVGMGDSYASGEGMPDVPAVTGIAPAQWLDEKCHRSLLSAQSLTAARLAAENPHQSVTFISRACSGAIIADLIDLPQTTQSQKRLGRVSSLCYGGHHKTDCPNDEAKILPTQLAAIQNDIKSDSKVRMRSPNLVLLSITGNDFGFVDAIVDLLKTDVIPIDPNNPKYSKNKKHDLAPEFIQKALKKRTQVWENYPILVSKLTNPYTGFPDATFVHTGYPNPLMRDGKEKRFCLADEDKSKEEFFQISEQTGLVGNTVDFLINRAKLKASQDEYIALHNDYLMPLTGSVKCLAKLDDPEKKECKANLHHDFGLRPAMIAASCALNKNRRDLLENSDGLQAMYDDPICNYLKDGKVGFDKFDAFMDNGKNSKWRFSLARNESGTKDGIQQLDGFVVNGFCIGNSKVGVQGRWFNVLGDALVSMSSTGDMLFGIATSAYTGTAHPNIYGQLFLAQRSWVAIPDEFKQPKQ